MQLELSKKEFRRLLDMVYIGNWILNSTRGEDRFQDYDKVESLLFEKARQEGMGILAETYQGETIPSRPIRGGGPSMRPLWSMRTTSFFDILAEDLAPPLRPYDRRRGAGGLPAPERRQAEGLQDRHRRR